MVGGLGWWRNVSWSAVRNRDPPTGDFFQKAGREFQKNRGNEAEFSNVRDLPNRLPR